MFNRSRRHNNSVQFMDFIIPIDGWSFSLANSKNRKKRKEMSDCLEEIVNYEAVKRTEEENIRLEIVT